MSKERQTPRLPQSKEAMSIPLPRSITNSAIRALYESSGRGDSDSFKRSAIGFSTAC
jgi:hypothetical protein